MKTERDIPSSLDLVSEIKRLRTEMNAVILAHYYQDGEIQDIADFVGDSLELSRKAAATDADVIVFCGVRFMADVAKILSPKKLVLLPDMNAGCSLEDSCKPEPFKKFREAHPDHTALTYINSSIEVKAHSDVIVTSANAEAIIRQIPESQPILFSPDKYLGAYLAKKTGRKNMLMWDGTCIVHEQFSEKALVQLIIRHPEAHVIAHPECPEFLLRHAEYIGSTSGIIKFAEERPGQSFIVLTEPGILHVMKKRSPGSTFYDVPGTADAACANCNNCPFMKMNTLEKLYLCMVNRAPVIEVEEGIRLKAKQSLDRMLDMSKGVKGLTAPSPTVAS
ncbi:MAG: quinolinate synthase NadA [Proteobacteria bacterium]|nr:quinolinate synthase NadA [Pseudomonadota bacterium]